MGLIANTIDSIIPPDQTYAAAAKKRLDNLTKPKGSLGVLEDVVCKLAAIRRTDYFFKGRKIIFTLAADHGVAEEGVSLYPQEVTYQMVSNFLRGGAAINVITRFVGAENIIVDMGVKKRVVDSTGCLKLKRIGPGTRNMRYGPAMTRDDAERAIESGIELIMEEKGRSDVGIVGTGDMGIGNTTASSAIAAVLTGKSVEEVVGSGTGISQERLLEKIRVIEDSIKINSPESTDPLDVLGKIGGFEIAGITGIILGCAASYIPVVIDGFISGAAALLACRLNPLVSYYIIASHMSFEKGHKILLEDMKLRPLLNLDLRLGEGTGAALALPLIESACRLFSDMATFSDAGVTDII